jgi:hypothetical protein
MFQPFQNDTQNQSIGDLNIENGTNEIFISGSLTFTRDDNGRRCAELLKDIIDKIVAELTSETTAEDNTTPPEDTANPFNVLRS